uniref:Uncharacterized protein n=1 Tax=Octopus bimaculoides TaxID=37653 RepID=A0A0L8IE87_OCTBM
MDIGITMPMTAMMAEVVASAMAVVPVGAVAETTATITMTIEEKPAQASRNLLDQEMYKLMKNRQGIFCSTDVTNSINCNKQSLSYSTAVAGNIKRQSISF